MKITGPGGMLVALAMLASCGGGSGSGDATSAVPAVVPTTAVLVVATPVVAATPAMTLGTVTHFSQGWSTSILTSARTLGVSTMRDEINWGDVEKKAPASMISAHRASPIPTSCSPTASSRP